VVQHVTGKSVFCYLEGDVREQFFHCGDGESVSHTNRPFPPFHVGPPPPLIICSATARTNILYCKAWKEIDILPVRAFGAGTLRSHAYTGNDILSHQGRSSTLRYHHLSLRLHVTSPIWILSFLFFLQAILGGTRSILKHDSGMFRALAPNAM
jgi:hypothetical protein